MPNTDQIFDKKAKFINKAIETMDANVAGFQSKLLDLLTAEYLPLFDIKDGIILDTNNNTTLIGKLDRFMDKLEKVLHRDILAPFANNLLKSAVLSGDYYVGMGFKKSVVNNLISNKLNLEGKLGFTGKGTLKKDGYLYQLGKTEQVRHQLKTYVINSLTGDVPFLDFQLGFRNLVIGNKRVKGLATKGAYQKFFDQYAYDSFNTLDATANKQISDNLGLKHFIYVGSLIKTSRAFCRKRAGKAFTVAETKAWKNDPTLIEKSTKDSYKPLIDRGRYRCRHFIKYITLETYNKIK